VLVDSREFDDIVESLLDVDAAPSRESKLPKEDCCRRRGPRGAGLPPRGLKALILALSLSVITEAVSHSPCLSLSNDAGSCTVRSLQRFV